MDETDLPDVQAALAYVRDREAAEKAEALKAQAMSDQEIKEALEVLYAQIDDRADKCTPFYAGIYGRIFAYYREIRRRKPAEQEGN